MIENNKTTPAQDLKEQDEEIRSDLEKIEPEGMTIGSRIKDVVSTMKREDILEPYNSAGDKENDTHDSKH